MKELDSYEGSIKGINVSSAQILAFRGVETRTDLASPCSEVEILGGRGQSGRERGMGCH